MRLSRAIIILFLGLTACSSSGNDFFPIFTPYIDVAVGDDANGIPADSKVLLYFDALLNPSADVTLNNSVSLINTPRSVVLADEDLYVANTGGGTVTLYRSYWNLKNNAAPDVTLAAVAGINAPHEIVVKGNTLFVADSGDNEVNIFLNAAALAADTAPSVTLNNGSSLINDPDGMDYDGSALYVANSATPSVTIYRDVATLVTNDAPDVTLGAATSFQSLSTGFKSLTVAHDILYVSSEPGLVFIFEEASGLLSDALPDAVLDTEAGFSGRPADVALAGANVFVALQPLTGADETTGLLAFGPQGEITGSADPFLTFSEVPAGHVVEAAGDALIVSVMNEEDAGNANHEVFIYTNAAFFFEDLMISEPAVTLKSSEFIRPLAIDAVER